MSSSDSGSPPPKKASKREAKGDENEAAKKAKAESEREKNSDGDELIDLGSKKFASARQWKGKWMVDIREYYEKDGELRPGKKGITLNPAQFAKLQDALPELADKINQ